MNEKYKVHTNKNFEHSLLVQGKQAAGKKLSTSEKLSLDAKLVDAKLQVKRAAAYIDAITSSEKIKDLTSKLDAAHKVYLYRAK